MKKFIVIPTYNERENIRALVEAIFSLGIDDMNIVVVDDGSPDGTGKVANGLSKNYPLIPIHRREKLGLGSAYIAGFKKALEMGADLIFEMDADFSHDPKYLPELIGAVKNGFDVALGSRRIRGGKVVGWNWWRHFCSGSAMLFARLVLGLKTRDVTAGFRCYKAQVLRSLDLDRIKSNGYAFQEEMVYLCEKKGFKVKEVPIVFNDRERGKSKLGLSDIVEFFVTVLELRLRKG